MMSSTLRAIQAPKDAKAQKTETKSKYGNKKTVVDGIAFDSKKEAKRYGELKLLERAGQIEGLVLQQKFLLFPKQRRDDGKAERECSYVADFAYQENGRLVVEDTKGVRTTDYVIKRKAMLAIHGISVREL